MINPIHYFIIDNSLEPEINTKTEAVDARCSVKKLFLKVKQNPQENTG